MSAINKCTRVFISHASEDRQTASSVKSWIKLAYNNVDIFLSSANGIHCGENPDKSLTNAIQTSDVLVLLLTPVSAEREWLVFEAGGVFGRKKTVLPILCNGVALEKVPPPIRQMFQVKDAKRADEFTDFLNALDSAIGRQRTKSGEELRTKLKKGYKISKATNEYLEIFKRVCRGVYVDALFIGGRGAVSHGSFSDIMKLQDAGLVRATAEKWSPEPSVDLENGKRKVCLSFRSCCIMCNTSSLSLKCYLLTEKGKELLKQTHVEQAEEDVELVRRIVEQKAHGAKTYLEYYANTKS